MLEKRNILYFTPFYFQDDTSKHKSFVVLENSDGTNILASLPTSRDSVPEKSEIQTGCIELPEIGFNCFVIPPNVPVAENGKSFTVKTHVYGHQIDLHNASYLTATYPIENVHYQVWGKMNEKLFDELIDCLKNSKNVKRKYKRMLGGI